MKYNKGKIHQLIWENNDNDISIDGSGKKYYYETPRVIHVHAKPSGNKNQILQGFTTKKTNRQPGWKHTETQKNLRSPYFEEILKFYNDEDGWSNGKKNK